MQTASYEVIHLSDDDLVYLQLMEAAWQQLLAAFIISSVESKEQAKDATRA